MVYNEIQPLKKTWAFPLVLLLQLGIGVLAVSGGFSANQPEQAWIGFGLVLLLTGGLLLLFLHMRLEIRMDASGLQFRSPPFVNSWRKHGWEEIRDMQLLSTRSFNWLGGRACTWEEAWASAGDGMGNGGTSLVREMPCGFF
ncbi:hypothetical protein [Cyclobacterium xiamenense]|uniref:hypothetical protein n=1 Tax=Cyclobacterium xiamenense TaxID=1297121 RepID=UPI0035D0B280